MKILKLFILFTLVLPLTLGGCKDEFSLEDYVSVSRKNIYTADYKGATVTAYFERREDPILFDGIKCATYGFLTVKLPTKLTEGKYSFYFNGHTTDFVFDAVKSVLVAKIPCDTPPVDSFDATVTIESERTDIKFTTIVPNGIIGESKALSSLYEHQKSYIDNLKNGDEFNAEIIIKVSVFKGEPYYYVAIAEKNGSFKALLIDAYTAEVLAMRNVFN